MRIGVILAAGKGTRINVPDKNKTVLEFDGKPLIQYGIDLFSPFCEEILIVVGAKAESVKEAVGENPKIRFVTQEPQQGTGDAARVAVQDLLNRELSPDQILVGYGDHMMFYPQKVVEELIRMQKGEGSALALVSTSAPDPTGFGRVIRDQNGQVIKFIEEKDAGEEEKKISEINAGFYCFDFQFLAQNINNLKRSEVTSEYYINDFVDLAISQGLTVSTLKVPFEYVGIGINTKEQLRESEQLHKSKDNV